MDDLKIDSTQENGFLFFFRSLPEKPSSTIQFFDRTDYWTVHGDDALYLADEIFKTQTILKQIGSHSSRLNYLIVNKGNFDTVVRDLLLVKQYRIEVFKVKNIKNHDWSLAYKASPGNLAEFEDLLFGSGHNSLTASGLMAIRNTKQNDKNITGIAFCDQAIRHLVVCELVESCDIDEMFINIESVLVQLRPRECLVQAGTPELKSLKRILERNFVLVSERKKVDFDGKDIVQDLNRLIKFPSTAKSKNFSTFPESSLSTALTCLAGCIKYLQLISDESNFGMYQIETFRFGQFMKLDGPASRALNLLPSPNDGNGPFRCLYALLNKCRTSSGQRLLASWIHQPLIDIKLIEDRLDVVSFLRDSEDIRRQLHDTLLRTMPDILRASRKLQTKNASLQDCYRIYIAIKKIPEIVNCLESSGVKAGNKDKIVAIFINPLKELISDFANYTLMIESTIDMDQVDNQEFLVRPEFDETLLLLKKQLEETEDKIKKELNKVARDLNLESGKSIKLESNSQLGYYFRVTRKEEIAIRNNRSYEMLSTNKNGVQFRNSALETFNQSHLTLKQEFTDQQKGVVSEILSVASGYTEPLSAYSYIVSRLDVLTAFATVASDAPLPYIRPKLLPMGSGRILMKDMRHPCIERQDGASFIPNDIQLDKNLKSFQIITGPNMGGKSTYIRSVGTVVLMAHLGCYVPCSVAEVTIVDCILARVGASDDQLKGVSTFMAEMLETSTILKTASENSLVIIDELGRGTSTFDGFGLAWAIADYISRMIRSFCLFATHFHELTSLAKEIDTVGNLRVTAITNQDNLTLLYKVEPGICDQSFGIHVAEMVNFPKHVIENARRQAIEMEQSTKLLLIGQSSFKNNQSIIANDVGEIQSSKTKESNLIQRMTQEEITAFLLKAKQIYEEEKELGSIKYCNNGNDDDLESDLQRENNQESRDRMWNKLCKLKNELLLEKGLEIE